MIKFIIFSIISLLFVFFIFFINFFFYSKKYLISKNSIYECGFENFSNLNENFDLKYFIIGIVFLIFDIELIFLFPLSINFFFLGFFGY